MNEINRKTYHIPATAGAGCRQLVDAVVAGVRRRYDGVGLVHDVAHEARAERVQSARVGQRPEVAHHEARSTFAKAVVVADHQRVEVRLRRHLW